MRYIHLSGRDLSDKLSRGMAQIHQWRVGMLTEQPDSAAAGVMSSEPG
jgi:integrase/recombinase XerD